MASNEELLISRSRTLRSRRALAARVILCSALFESVEALVETAVAAVAVAVLDMAAVFVGMVEGEGRVGLAKGDNGVGRRGTDGVEVDKGATTA